MVCFVCISFFFFFQAEDGIRDLVRSRGLGDVYKRQLIVRVHGAEDVKQSALAAAALAHHAHELAAHHAPVSYTHLTLPTSDLV